MRIANQIMCRFSSCNAQYLLNKNKNAVRFESQNLNWDYQVAEYHCKAFAKGLKSIPFSDNDNLLIRLPPAQMAEAYVSKVATASINANLIISQANSLQELENELAQNNIKGFIFQPTLPLGEQLIIDGLYRMMPQLKNCQQGGQIQPSRFSALKMLIQTNFYTLPGVFKYRSVFNYANDLYSPFKTSDSLEPVSLPSSDLPLVITQPAHSFAFKAGILNSLINGRFVICAQSSEVSKISHIHDNKIEVVATEECSVADSVKVYVENGSEVMKDHGNRSIC